jgi:cell division protein FtsI/penicillin-binding protein 2/cell division protein FtsW (lipid II flippase)
MQELRLVVLSVAILLVMFFLLILSKGQSPPNHLLLNALTAEEFSRRLEIERPLAERIVQWRTAQGKFLYTDQILEIRLFTKSDAERLAGAWAEAGLEPQEATVDQIAKSLKVPKAFGERIVAYLRGIVHTPRPSDSWEDRRLQALRFLSSIPLLDSVRVRPLLAYAFVREAREASALFVGNGFLLLLVVFLAPPLMRFKLKGDPYLLILGLLISGMGMFLLYSIKDPLKDAASYLNHLQGIFISLPVFLVAGSLRAEARNHLRRYQYIWGLSAILLMLALFLFGTGPSGVRLTLFRFQPVEIIKILLLLFLASYLAERGESIADSSSRWRGEGKAKLLSKLQLPRREDVAPLSVMYGLALLLFLIVKDMGPGLVLFTTFIALLYLQTGRSSFLWVGGAMLVLGGFVAYEFHLGVFGTRVDMWLNPFANPHPNGMQLAQGYWGMATGGFEGSGLGLGLPTSIPRSGSDLAFASWAEETGWIGALFLLALYSLLIWRGLRISLRARTNFDRALGFGFTLLLGLQTLVIVGGVVGLLPLSGISLPFLSYGNSAMVAHFFLLGVLRGISATQGSGELAVPTAVERCTNRFAWGFVALLFGVVGVLRLGVLQWVKGTDFATQTIRTPDADGTTRPHVNPRLLALERAIGRGTIFDRNGKVLATSRAKEIEASCPDAEVAMRLVRAKARYYPYGEWTAHLVGYLEGSAGGSAGFEKTYDNDLRGFANYADLLKDYRSRNLPGYRARVGHDVVLTLDAELQKQIAQAMRETTQKLHDKRTGKKKNRAAFVLLEPATGEVLACLSTPSFDPNGLTQDQVHEFTTGDEAKEDSRLFNRAVAGLYPPGSTFKVATTLAALESGIDPLQFRVACNQIAPSIRWRENGTTYLRRNTRDDKGDPSFGTIALPTAFRVSSNIYFAHLAVELGAERFWKVVHDQLHFRYAPTSSSFEADLPDLGYGQGRMVATPLEMARLAGTVANDGKMMEPHFVKRLRAESKKEEKVITDVQPQELGTPLSKANAQKLKSYMRDVVARGTAKGVFSDLPFEVAGKTGTAQTERGDREPHSWFIGFAPAIEGETVPRFAFACVVENGGYGKRVAAVICRDALRLLK